MDESGEHPDSNVRLLLGRENRQARSLAQEGVRRGVVFQETHKSVNEMHQLRHNLDYARESGMYPDGRHVHAFVGNSILLTESNYGNLTQS